MSKRLSVCLLVVAILCIASVLAVLSFVPRLEAQLIELTEYNLKANDISLKEPLKLTISPFTRRVEIEPFLCTYGPESEREEISIGHTTCIFTWEGLLALSPMRSIFSPTGEIKLIEREECAGIQFSLKTTEITLKNIQNEDVRIDAAYLQKVLTENAILSYEHMHVSTIHCAGLKVVMSDTDMTFTTGAIDFAEITSSFVGAFSLEDVSLLEENELIFRFAKLTQKDIRVLSEDEGLALAQTLISLQAMGQGTDLLELLLSMEPLVGRTHIQDLTIHWEDTDFQFTELSLTSSQENTSNAHTLALTGMDVERATLEELIGEGLPIQEHIKLNLTLNLTKKDPTIYTLKAVLDLPDLFALDGQVSASLPQLNDLTEQLLTAPLSEARLRYTDHSFLARTVFYLEKQGMPLAQIQKELLAPETATAAEKALANDLARLLERPGTLTIALPQKTTSSFVDLMQYNETEILDHLVITVEEGSTSLTEQLKTIQPQ